MWSKIKSGAEITLNGLKDAYFWIIDKIEHHPHWAFWLFAIAFLLLVRV